MRDLLWRSLQQLQRHGYKETVRVYAKEEEEREKEASIWASQLEGWAKSFGGPKFGCALTITLLILRKGSIEKSFLDGYYRHRKETSEDLARNACDVLNLVAGTQKGDSLCGRVAYQTTALRYVLCFNKAVIQALPLGAILSS